MNSDWGVVGCAYMAREYCKVLVAKGMQPTVFSRDVTSSNVLTFKTAFPQLEVRTLDQLDTTIENWIVCTNIDSHAAICDRLAGRIYCEKPFSMTTDYPTDRDIRLLMNRRYYYWVQQAKDIVASGDIVKAVACIPEKSVDALITQSIHVIDLLWHLTGAFGPATRIGNACPTFILTASNALPVVINMNYGAHENFSIRLYAKDGTVYEARPLESFCVTEGMEVREPTDDMPLRSYRPIVRGTPPPATQFKPGLEDLVDDLLVHSATRLPTLAEHREIHAWMERNML